VSLREAAVTPPESNFAQFDPAFGDFDDAARSIRSQHRHVSQLQTLQQPFTNKARIFQPNLQSTDVAMPLPPSSMSEAEGDVPRISDISRPSGLPLFAEPKPGLINTGSESSQTAVRYDQSNSSAVRRVPPIVRVSIGRIEVRAELPERAPAPAPQRNRPSHVSLEQFLKQAGRGAR
jgi:hypothetical protein